MVKIETIKQKLQQILSERRYRHSLGVADEAKKLALHYGADTEKAYLAGLVHDCAKEIPPARMQELMIHRYGMPRWRICRDCCMALWVHALPRVNLKSMIQRF